MATAGAVPHLLPRQRLRRALRLPGVLLAAAAALPLGGLAAAGTTGWARRTWCRLLARALALQVGYRGPPPPPGALLAANHIGYLDIVALGAVLPGRFLAKREIAHWPVLGWICRRGGSVFIDRDNARSSHTLLQPLTACLQRGERIVWFPEGQVSADGRTLRPFHPMVFQVGVSSGQPVVPVALRYGEPDDPRVWGWFDGVGLWRHLWRQILTQRRIEVEVRVGVPLWPSPGEDRKALADRTRRAVARLLEVPPEAAG